MPAPKSEALARLVPSELRELLRAQTLSLRRPVWGRRHGRHRSARAGVGLDFRDHRAYVPGDDPRLLDWRAVARRNRLVLRQTESEDELSLVLAVDLGGSMAYGDGTSHKLRAVRAFAGGLAWLASRQGDPVGVAAGTAGEIDTSLARPHSGDDKIVALAELLAGTVPTGRCAWEELLAHIAPRLPRRSLLVAISDFLDLGSDQLDPDTAHVALMRGMTHLRARGHDVVMIQVLHRDELTFPWTERRMLRFVDLRSYRPLVDGPGSNLRDGYLERIAAHLRRIEVDCEAGGVYLHRVVTDEPVGRSFMRLVGRLAGEDAVAEEAAG